MSSYLLLRNNQESGPFTMEEIKGMSLRAYDLLWVVGKSAAWRYPGEIAEFKSLAPPVPDQFSDSIFKKTDSENTVPDAAAKKSESSNSRENKIQRTAPYRSVYVNLPADKKQASISTNRIRSDSGLSRTMREESNPDFSDLLYKKRATPAVRFSGNILWVSTVILLFGAGILTGFFISDRRIFFSTDANHPQNLPAVHQEVLNSKKEISPLHSPSAGNTVTNQAEIKYGSSKKTVIFPIKSLTGTGKKNFKNNTGKKDTVVSPVSSSSTLKLNDSVRQNAISNKEMIFEKIRAHPENYVNLVTGRYSTGLFGGISSFPVTVTNNSPATLDLVVINIDYIQNNEKVFKTESLSINDLEPGETVSVKAPKSPRGTKIAARIQFVNPHQPEFGNSH